VESFDIGEDTGTAVNKNYEVPFTFTGTLNKVTIDLKSQDKKTAQADATARLAAALEVLKQE
jgi:arylsulfatase